jgi:hypothetical protein
VDGTRFDQLIKSMATTRITRLTALRGLAVGAVAAAVGIAAPDEADAKCKKTCDQCSKKVKKKTNSGKVRCRCRAKANGTLCSIPGATSATCLNGACIAAVSPPVPPPPGPSQICTPNTQTGCTGGQVCNAAGTACVNCISDDPCGTEFDCVNGRCVPATPRD